MCDKIFLTIKHKSLLIFNDFIRRLLILRACIIHDNIINNILIYSRSQNIVIVLGIVNRFFNVVFNVLQILHILNILNVFYCLGFYYVLATGCSLLSFFAGNVFVCLEIISRPWVEILRSWHVQSWTFSEKTLVLARFPFVAVLRRIENMFLMSFPL